ncbi:MAG: tripartite tricarboxylate transporter substrate binding protein [Candidatus Dadabacteria bacterium]|nr:MAG: tripartite tricarboxylate transporter substrate binding protein [Candidatus Dadabacteria bacterium]
MSFTKIYFTFLTVILLAPATLLAEYPERPVKIVVYTAPGGLIDITARKVADILKKNFVKTPVIVENKKGAGGVTALSYVLRRPADGYTLFGVTNSLITKITALNQDSRLKKLTFLAKMVKDYECLITRKNSGISNLNDLINDAKQKNGAQLWAGPAAGGKDHLFALKSWKAFGIKARWIPYRSGAEALVAVMGSHADVYVGNPADTAGRENLKILAVSSSNRLPTFSDVPTFGELGFNTLTNEAIWRGFAIRADAPDSIKQSVKDLLKKVSSTKEWQEKKKKNYAVPIFETGKPLLDCILAEIKRRKAFSG